MKVFISHAFLETDIELAQELKKILAAEGITGYLAETIKRYDKLVRDKIISEIKNSDHMVAILRKDSNDSPSVHQELGFALREGISPIIMQEENLKVGVLIFGLETEIFSKNSFAESCKSVLKHIQEKGSRERTPENISEQLEEIKSKINNLKPKVSINYSDKYPEIEWYDEIIKYCDHTVYSEEIGKLSKDVKEHYSKIRMIRQEIDEISKSYKSSSTMSQIRLGQMLERKRNELKNLLEHLRQLWIKYS